MERALTNLSWISHLWVKYKVEDLQQSRDDVVCVQDLIIWSHLLKAPAF